MLLLLFLYQFLMKRFKTVLLGRVKGPAVFTAKNDVNTFLSAFGGV